MTERLVGLVTVVSSLFGAAAHCRRHEVFVSPAEYGPTPVSSKLLQNFCRGAADREKSSDRAASNGQQHPR